MSNFQAKEIKNGLTTLWKPLKAEAVFFRIPEHQNFGAQLRYKTVI